MVSLISIIRIDFYPLVNELGGFLMVLLDVLYLCLILLVGHNIYYINTTSLLHYINSSFLTVFVYSIHIFLNGSKRLTCTCS